MGRIKALPADMRGYREKIGKDRNEFWSRFGVAQSAASRYERENDPPVPVQILMWLELNGRIDGIDLDEALTSVVKTYLRRQAGAAARATRPLHRSSGTARTRRAAAESRIRE